MNMRHNIIYKVMMMVLPLIGGVLASCSSEIPDIRYEGSEFVQFADSIYDIPVTQDEKVFEIPVVFSTKADVDRHIIVDIDRKNSNATEGFHFTLETRNLTIPAGQLTASVRIKGIFRHIETSDSLAITLKILNHENEQSAIYGNKTVVHLIKVLPFHIEDYVGDMLMTCTFPFSTSETTTFLLTTEKVDDHTLRIMAPFEDARNLTIRFNEDPENPFYRDITVRKQIAFTDVNYGPVSMSSVEGYPSYYIPQDRAFVLYMLSELEHVGAFGTHYYIFRWITPDEATARRNGLITLY